MLLFFHQFQPSLTLTPHPHHHHATALHQQAVAAAIAHPHSLNHPLNQAASMMAASMPPPHLTQSSLGSPIQAAGQIPTSNAQQQNQSMVTGQQNSPPCSTLFIANLGQFVSEQELKDLFSVFPVSHTDHYTDHYIIR